MTNAVIPPAMPADLIELGRITGAYGIKGWVKVQPYSADAGVLLSLSQWWLMRTAPVAGQSAAEPTASPVKVQSVRPQGATVVAQLAGITDRDQAEAMRGMGVHASRSVFPGTEQDEYYWVDLIGCTLYGQDQGQPVLLGLVDDVTDNGAHAILKVHRQVADPAGTAPQAMVDAKGKPVELLVPFVGAHIHGVDLHARRIDSDWPPEF